MTSWVFGSTRLRCNVFREAAYLVLQAPIQSFIMERTLSFSVTKIYGVYNKHEWMQEVYGAIIKDHEEGDVETIQVYPADWPRRVRLMVKDLTVKQKLQADGIEVFNQHIDLDDDLLGPPVVVTVVDTPIEMPFERVVSVLESFGKVQKIEDDYLEIDGKQTKWKTGVRLVTMAGLTQRIPERITVNDELERASTILLRCEKQPIRSSLSKSPKLFCKKCGSKDHQQDHCESSQKLCYLCGSNSHLRKDCSSYQATGVRENEEMVCFKGENATFSNFNKDFPIVVDGKTFKCNEQYIVYRKAEMFNDEEAAEQVMGMTDPRKMKQLGHNIRHYNHKVWQENCVEVITHCNEVKYTTHENAMKALLATKGKKIAEATQSKEWGVGISLDNEDCLNYSRWTGQNKMGVILMEIRDKVIEGLDHQSPKLKTNTELPNSQTMVTFMPAESDEVHDSQSKKVQGSESNEVPNSETSMEDSFTQENIDAEHFVADTQMSDLESMESSDDTLLAYLISEEMATAKNQDDNCNAEDNIDNSVVLEDTVDSESSLIFEDSDCPENGDLEHSSGFNHTNDAFN